LSTLTKILIVLLTLSSIFLCGIVVTYVANADDYRQQNKTLRTRLDLAVQKRRSAEDQLAEKKDKYQQFEANKNKEIASLKTKIRKLENDLTNTKREKANLLVKVNSWVSITQDLTKTNLDQRQLFEKTFEELNKVKAEQIKEHKELDDVTTELNEKMAIIATLEADKKRLEEEKSQLQTKLDKFLRGLGREAVVPQPVTPTKAIARPAQPVTKEIGLKGLVTAVDLKNSVAEISIGTARGVRKGMKFYVTRGEEFICELRIHFVDAEKAVGDLQLVQKQPRVGDSVSTNL